MTTVTITCPHCGFAKDIPAERLPQREVRVTCPKCKQGFPFTRDELYGREATLPRQEAVTPVPVTMPARQQPSLLQRPLKPRTILPATPVPNLAAILP